MASFLHQLKQLPNNRSRYIKSSTTQKQLTVTHLADARCLNSGLLPVGALLRTREQHHSPLCWTGVLGRLREHDHILSLSHACAHKGCASLLDMSPRARSLLAASRLAHRACGASRSEERARRWSSHLQGASADTLQRQVHRMTHLHISSASPQPTWAQRMQLQLL